MQPYPEYESRSLIMDILKLHRARAVRLSDWQLSNLRAMRAKPVGLSERERLAVRRISLGFSWLAWGRLPAPEEAPNTTAERAAMGKLGLLAPKPPRRKKGQPKVKKERRKEKAEGELPCPVCRTGAKLKFWTDRGGRISFYCQNSHCVKKI